MKITAKSQGISSLKIPTNAGCLVLKLVYSNRDKESRMKEERSARFTEAFK